MPRRRRDVTHERYLIANPYEDSTNSRRRATSESRISELQYYTPRGSIPATTAAAAIHRDLEGITTRSGQPHKYRNEEGNRDARSYSLFSSYQTGRNTPQLYEHPVRGVHEQPFEHHTRTASLRQLEAPLHRNDRDRLMRRPYNDAGPFRSISSSTRDGVVGVVYHPHRRSEAFEAATLERIGRQGRQDQQRYRDRILSQDASRLSFGDRIGNRDSSYYTYSGSYPPR